MKLLKRLFKTTTNNRRNTLSKRRNSRNKSMEQFRRQQIQGLGRIQISA